MAAVKETRLTAIQRNLIRKHKYFTMALKNKTHEIEKPATTQRAPQQIALNSPEHERPLNPVDALQRATGSHSSALRPTDILALQRTIGNRAVQRMLAAPTRNAQASASVARPIIQAKLTIGPVGDKYEQEAEQVARQVMSMDTHPAGSSIQRASENEEEDLQMKPAAISITPLVQRQTSTEDLQTSSLQCEQSPEAVSAAPGIEAAIQQARGGGQPLPETLRARMERAFGADFGGVRVHTDAQADSLNRALQARAFTTGENLFFKQGEYNPHSSAGQEIIAHELTHVVQQTGKRGRDDKSQSNKLSRQVEFSIQRDPLTNKEQAEKTELEKDIAKFEKEKAELEEIHKGQEHPLKKGEPKESIKGKPALDFKNRKTRIAGLLQIITHKQTRLDTLIAKEKFKPPTQEEIAKKKKEEDEQNEKRKAKERQERQVLALQEALNAKAKADKLLAWKGIITDGLGFCELALDTVDKANGDLKTELTPHEPTLLKTQAVVAVTDALDRAKNQATSASRGLKAIDHTTEQGEVEGHRNDANAALTSAKNQDAAAKALTKTIASTNGLANADNDQQAARSIKYNYLGEPVAETLTLEETYSTNVHFASEDPLGWGSEYLPKQAAGKWVLHTHRKQNGDLDKVHTKKSSNSGFNTDIELTDRNKKTLKTLNVNGNDLNAGKNFDGRKIDPNKELEKHRTGK